MSICLAGARAEASRRNGARSRGPTTADGKARSAQNALKHGLRANRFVVVGDEKAAEFAALEAALSDELAPEGALQGVLAGRIARAAWRLERAERIEAELFALHADRDRNFGLALVRDGNGARAFDTLLRYRGTALAELWRALRLLKALQAEAHPSDVREAVPQVDTIAAGEKPIEPEARTNPGEIAPAPAADEPEVRRHCADAGEPYPAADRPEPRENLSACRENPIKPEARRNPGEVAPVLSAGEPEMDGSRRRRGADEAEPLAARPGSAGANPAPEACAPTCAS